MRHLIPAGLALLVLHSPVEKPVAAAPEAVAINDNTRSAGTLRDGVLRIRLDIRPGTWRPDAADGPGVSIWAFGDAGKPLQVPGPLIRATEGTVIEATIRNTVDKTLVVRGLFTRGGSADTVQVAAGSTREVRFTAGAPGTYYYWASSDGAGNLARRGQESLLAGGLIVDPRGTRIRDRVMVLALWSDTALTIAAPNLPVRMVINGKSWPNTERYNYKLGDSIRWRVINVSSLVHPMHLHGFYYRVDSRGGMQTDTIYSTEARRMVVTERLAPGQTMSLTWVPERPGNWLFHCHDNVHILRNARLPGQPALKASAHVNHATDLMGGLVMGVHVSGSSKASASNTGRRALRLVARVDTGSTTGEPFYGFELQERGRTVNAEAILPGPPIVLRRGEPVSITVVNQLPEATAVHWHGIELDSYFDGVADFAGMPGRIAPAIMPRDSFEARFTPPRAGTFIYHTHVDEVRQQQAGLSGPLLVVDPDKPYDPAREIIVMLSTPRRAADASVIYLNGSTKLPVRELSAGTTYRVRIINIHTARPSMIVSLMQRDSVLTWRAVAKDGWDLQPALATTRRATQQFGNGETYDFEIQLQPGEYHLNVVSAAGAPLADWQLRAR